MPAGLRAGQGARHRSLADAALTGLFGETQVDAGALLLLPRDFEGEPTAADLEIIASRTASDLPYHRVSNFLAATVLREGEAVLARNVMGDSTLGSRDSKGRDARHERDLRSGPPRQDGRSAWSICIRPIRPAFPIPTISSSRWPWPTQWPWRSKTSAAGRSWPKT